ncbi:MAG TPA: NAD(P)H-dependent oxidoreductase [Anaerolineae bacterium]|nr:NAD(P)H-dependent oxidoreductase [Anaerolineae bacterium]
MKQPVNVLGFAGSLRKGSYNRAALRAAKQLAPETMRLDIFELNDIPLYNGDVEAQGFPLPVQEFKAKIEASDALLIVTPEYNYSIPGVLKNAIDWASRPPTETPLDRKPTAIMGASTSRFGTVRSQLHLRQVCFGLNMPVLPQPEVYILRARDKFDAAGNLTDERSASQIKKLLQALVEWTITLKVWGSK